MAIKELINGALAPLGVRMVNARWGPRGEWAPLARLKALGFAPRQIVDAGAYRGQWTRQCLELFPAARVLMIDPLPENAPALQELCREHPNCSLFAGGVGDQPALLTLYSDRMRSSFLASEVFDQSRSVQVEVRTLDSLLDTPLLQPPQLIKADVQGFELKLLRGAGRCLATTELLLLEASFRACYTGGPLADELIAAVSQLGFVIFDICTYHVDGRNGDLLQSDILFCRRNSPWLHYDGQTPVSPD